MSLLQQQPIERQYQGGLATTSSSARLGRGPSRFRWNEMKELLHLAWNPQPRSLRAWGGYPIRQKVPHSRQNIPLDSRYGRMFGVRNKQRHRAFGNMIDKSMKLVEEKEKSEHLPNDTSPMLRETKELKRITKIRELTRAKVMLEFQPSLLD